MLVSQYIFTACGKRKNGDFVLWAKSPDITEAEGEEIHQMMGYKNPAGVNLYEATEEEIAAACPTKYAYFILSTGKKVLTESNFIGRVYSDADKRWGNFFIHAYVFDSLGDVMPMSVLKKGLFRRKLEYTEWHDEPCPESLPQIELNPVQINIREVEAFLTTERKELLLPLLQSVISASNGGPVVNFSDTEENQVLWHTVIGMLLPSALRESVTFANQVVPMFNSATAVPGRSSAKPVVVRNLVKGATQTTSPMNKPVSFDFINNVIPSVALDSYLAELGNALNKNLMNALGFTKDIENLCALYGCTSDKAVALYMIKNNRPQWFTSFEGYVNTLELAEKLGMVSTAESAGVIYRTVFANGLWAQEILPLPVLKKLYTYCEQGVKDELISYYVSHLSAYGVSSQDPSAYAGSFFAQAPFGRDDYIRFMASKNALGTGFAQGNEFCVNYLIYDTLLKEYGNLKIDWSYPRILEIFKHYAVNAKYNEISLLISGAYSVNGELAEGLVREFADGIDPAGYTDLLFYFIEKVKSSVLQLDLLKKAVGANAGNPSFITIYIGYFNKNTAVYSPLEQMLVRDPQFASIQIARETYAFRTNPNVNRNDLNAYFRKYYLSGADNGLYFEKLKGYLRSRGDARCAFEIYSDISGANANSEGIKEIYLHLQSVLYSPPVSEILKYSKQESSLLDELDAKLERAGIPNSKGAFVKFVRTLLASGRDRETASQLIRSIHDMDILAQFDARQIDSLVNDYLSDLLDLYLNFRTPQGNKASDREQELYNISVLANLLGKPLYSHYFLDEFSRVAPKLNSKNYLNLLTDMFIFVGNYSGECREQLEKVLTRFINGLPNKKKSDKLLAEILENTPEPCKPAVKAFTEKLGLSSEENNGGEGDSEGGQKKKGFFAQIFGFKKKKDD